MASAKQQDITLAKDLSACHRDPYLPIISLRKPNQSLPPCQDVVDILLHATEFDEPAALTLQMVEQASQSLEFLGAIAVRTMVDLLHVCRALHVLFQASSRRKFAVTKIALEAQAVPGVVDHPCVSLPLQEVLRDDAVSIALPQGFENALAVDMRCLGAGASFEMVRDAAGGGKALLAEGA